MVIASNVVKVSVTPELLRLARIREACLYDQKLYETVKSIEIPLDLNGLYGYALDLWAQRILNDRKKTI